MICLPSCYYPLSPSSHAPSKSLDIAPIFPYSTITEYHPMHYKNGREAHNGDKVLMHSFGKIIVGVQVQS
jgi:hypothetical protein